MADGVANVMKGRGNEVHDRVDGNDPANSVLVIALAIDTTEADGVLEDHATFSAIFGAAGNTECTFTNYARIILDDTAIGPSTVDNTANTRNADISDQTIANAGGAVNNDVRKLFIGYDPDSTTGTDTTVEHFAHYDTLVAASPITTNGSDLVFQIAALGYYSAA